MSWWWIKTFIYPGTKLTDEESLFARATWPRRRCHITSVIFPKQWCWVFVLCCYLMTITWSVMETWCISGKKSEVMNLSWASAAVRFVGRAPSLCASQQSREVLASLKPQQQFLSSGLGYSGLQDPLVFVFASWLNVWVHLCLLTRDALFICASLCAYIKKKSDT